MKPIAWVGIGLLSAAAIGGYVVYRPYERARQVVACEYELGSAQDAGVGCLMLRFGWSQLDALAATAQRRQERQRLMEASRSSSESTWTENEKAVAALRRAHPLRDSVIKVPPGYHKCWDAAGNPAACKDE